MSVFKVTHNFEYNEMTNKKKNLLWLFGVNRKIRPSGPDPLAQSADCWTADHEVASSIPVWPLFGIIQPNSDTRTDSSARTLQPWKFLIVCNSRRASPYCYVPGRSYQEYSSCDQVHVTKTLTNSTLYKEKWSLFALFFLFLPINIDCGYSFEPRFLPTIHVLSRNKITS